ncbi:MAG TPA: hypothetical protein VHE35_30565 [Kofleriaceae bacterium]|nr:hypothetical protein [Kofleriaceae bacterium]
MLRRPRPSTLALALAAAAPSGAATVAAIAAVAAVACGDDGAGPADAAIDADPGPDELPCDVRAVLEDACTPCHSSPPVAGAPSSLTHRLDFRAPSTVDGEDLATRTAARLRDTVLPMPPRSEPPLSDGQRAVLDAWLTAGTPAGTCGAIAARPAPTTCASGQHWMQGDTGSIDMNPGRPCRACHQLSTPQLAYFFAGTVYPDYHEEDLCDSAPPEGARIEILDEHGAVTMTLRPSASGNFSSTGTAAGVAVPYTARLVANGLTREMTTAQDSGDCNSCHTEQGTHQATGMPDAPGRLVWPRPRP